MQTCHRNINIINNFIFYCKKQEEIEHSNCTYPSVIVNTSMIIILEMLMQVIVRTVNVIIIFSF